MSQLCVWVCVSIVKSSFDRWVICLSQTRLFAGYCERASRRRVRQGPIYKGWGHCWCDWTNLSASRLRGPKQDSFCEFVKIWWMHTAPIFFVLMIWKLRGCSSLQKACNYQNQSTLTWVLTPNDDSSTAQMLPGALSMLLATRPTALSILYGARWTLHP